MSTATRKRDGNELLGQPAAPGQQISRIASQFTELRDRKGSRGSKQRFGRLCEAAAGVLSPDELSQVAESVQKELERLAHLREAESAKGELLQAIRSELEPLGFPKQPAEQHRMLQEVLEESFRQRRDLLVEAFSAPQVASLLQTSRQTPLNRAQKGTLLAVYENGKWLFPRWQFDVHGPDGVLSGLPQVLEALQVSPIEKLSWFVRRSPYLENRTPLEALKSGETERVVSLARGVGAL
ncbi:MAG: hypothetical protein JWL77_2842 [Chthonomonadaceae bacterium]|nr:hypothetical protein [Chthonomonadaceae bacterium]